MRLAMPIEPNNLKVWMKSLKANHFGDPTIDWDSYIVWAGNKLPKYLWDSWKNELKPSGFTWQIFMKLLRYRTDRAVFWYRGALQWENYINEVISLIIGPLGKELTKNIKNNKRRGRTF